MKESIEASLAKERFSSDFIMQMMEHGQRKYGSYYNIFVILDKIKHLEASSFNKNTYKPLRKFGIENLFHVHHVQASCIAFNCINELKRKAGSLNMPMEEYEKLVLDTLFLYYYVIEKLDEEKAYQCAVARLSNIIFKDGYESRRSEKRLTGDWIVLYRKENKNYYLTLARHEEPDEEIKERVVEALKYFSFDLP